MKEILSIALAVASLIGLAIVVVVEMVRGL